MTEGAPGAASNHAIGSRRLRFGAFEADLATGELRKGGLKVRVPHHSFQILAMLLEKPGQVVTREELKRELWPRDIFVDFERGLNSAVQKLRSGLQDSAEQARYVETLPKLGYRFVAAVEQVLPVSEPSQPAATERTVALLSATETSEKVITVAPVRRRNWRYRALAAFTTLCLIALVPYLWYQYRRHRNQPPAQAHQSSVVVPSSRRRSIAVMGFKNVSGDRRSAWFSTAFTEMLATEMSAGGQLRTVAEEHVTRAKLELSLADKDSYASDTLTKIHTDLGCDYVIVGSYLALGHGGKGRLRLDARVQDAITGETVASVAVSGAQSQIFELATSAGERLRAKLSVEALSPLESEGVRATLPVTSEAARLYSEGLAKLRLWDNLAARDLMQKVIRLEPRYAPAYSALATALYALGYDATAAVAARQANELAGNLPERQRLELEGQYHEMNKEWPQAADVYLRLHQSYPDELDYGLEVVRTQYAMGTITEAVATLSALRKSASPERDDPRIDLADARIAGELANYKREKTLAETAARKSERARARLLLARAKLVEGYASDDLGDFSSALDAYAIADRIFTEFGNFDHSAQATMNVGIVLGEQGDLVGAQRKIEEAVNVFRKTGDQALLCAALSNLADIYRDQGELPNAERLVREALIIFEELNVKSQGEVLSYNLAALLQRQGRFHEAKGILESLLEHLRGGGNKSLLGAAMETCGSIAEAEGELPTALSMYQKAAALFKETGDKAEYAAAEQALGKAYLAQADFQSATRVLSDALSIDREINAKADAVLDQIALAKVMLEQGEPSDVSVLRSAQEELGRKKMTDGEIEAEVVIAQELIRKGETEEAAKIVSSATALSAKSYDPTVRFEVALTTARLRTAQHHFADASRALRGAFRRAIQFGCVSCQLEARLELGEIEIARGNLEHGRVQLRDLADEAQRRGFGLIAQRATIKGK